MTTEPDNKSAVEQAWKIHAAQEGWTARVDTKATFSFTFCSAVIGIAVGLSAKDRLYSGLENGTAVAFYWVGLIALMAGAVFAIITIIPRLKAADVKASASDNFIYFGHAQHWEADDLAEALKKREILPVITRQITVMADIAWQKHQWVQISMWCGTSGGAMLVASGLIQSSMR
ncbi:Pycsar system effector family protein [Specibacter sp. NPDC057265]|uniref:Pycsar system effector family protein n=1 Tax=Specibacter sp. NPDC057265 TaxID=3346075 RepID=UPI00362D1D96